MPPINGPGSTLSQNPRPALPNSPKLPYGLQLMARFDLLPRLRDTVCLQDSSYDRSGGNGDLGRFLRVEGNKAVLADIQGPGCIYRIWSANPAGQLRIYFDGEAMPRVDCPLEDFFLGKVAPFVAPLVGRKSGGWYSFFPMPFAKSCRVEVTNPGGMYYHVQYQRFPDTTPVRTFTRALALEDARALAAVRRQWEQAGEDPKTLVALTREVTREMTLKPGQSGGVSVQGPASIREIRVRATPANRFTLRQTLIKITWDGAKSPAVAAPLGDFFGTGFGDQRFRSLPNAMTDDGYVCFWPMPFRRAAKIEFVNVGNREAVQLSFSLCLDSRPTPPPNEGYFHAQWNRQTTVAGEPFPILRAKGRGHFVGASVAMQGNHGVGFLEGDEQIYVDGETFPSIYGTGSEDYYTGGWYFDEGPFSLPYHGCVVKDDGYSRIAAYRYQIQDCAPFQRDIRVDIEHGGSNDYPGADYASVAYWYQAMPEHEGRPIDLTQLTPARYSFADAQEAENLTWSGGNVVARDDRDLPAEVSGGKVMAVSGEKAAFSVEVKDDDVYSAQFSQLLLADSALDMRGELDGRGEDGAIRLRMPDPSALKVGERWDAFHILRLTPGKHTFALSIPAGKTMYFDYLRLRSSRKVKGVLEAESLAEKAATGGQGTVERQDGAEEWSGRSGLEWKPVGEMASLKLPVTLPADGDYALELGVVRDPNSPIISAQIDDGAPLATIDLAMPEGNADVQRVRFGRVTGLKAGAHTLTLVFRGAAMKSPALLIDTIRLTRSRYPDSIEAETLTILEAKSGQATEQEMTPFGADWSNDSQFWFRAQKEGAEVTVELPIQKAGQYKLSAYYTTARDYAIVQALLDGKPLGAPTDTFTEAVKAKGKTELGAAELTAGAHRLTFRVVGKNPRSIGYLVGVDAIGLEGK